MNGDRLEEFFRKKLGSYASDVPPGMWDRIGTPRNFRLRLAAFKRWYLFGSFGFICFLGAVSWAVRPASAVRAQATVSAVTVAAGTSATSSTPAVSNSVTRPGPGATLHNSTSADGRTANSGQSANSGRSAYISRSASAAGSPAAATVTVSSLSNLAAHSDRGPAAPTGSTAPAPQRLVSLVYSPTPGYLSTPKPRPGTFPSLQPLAAPAGAPGSTASGSCNYWYVDLFFSVERPNVNVTGPNSVANQFVRESQEMQSSYGGGFYVGRTFGQHFSAQAGFSYVALRSNFEILDSGFNGVEGKTNHYRFFDVPVLIGYTVGVGPLSLTAHAGAVLNVRSSFSGYILDDNLDTLNSGVFKTQAGLSLMGGIRAAYTVGDRIQLFGEPFIRYPLSPLSTPGQPFVEKINLEGFTFGIRYRFIRDHSIPCPQWR